MNAFSNDEPTQKRSWSLIAILLLMIVIIPGLGAMGIVSWWVSRQSVADAEVAQVQAEIQAQGLPIDDASITQFRRDKMDQSRSRRWMDLLDIVRSEAFQESSAGIPLVSTKSSEHGEGEDETIVGVPFQEQPSVDAYLERWKDLLTSIHQVTEGSGPIWTEVQFDSLNTQLPYTDATRQVARLLNLEFENAVRHNNAELALSCLIAGIGNARSMELEPTVISQLVSMANLHITSTQIKFTVEQDLFSPIQLGTILEHLRPLEDFGSGYRAAIAGERAMIQSAFDSLENQSSGSLGRLVIGSPVDRLTSLKIMAELESVSTETLDEFQSQTKVAETTIEGWLQRDTWLAKVDTTMSAFLTPSMAGISNAYIRSAMELRLIKVAIGCRLHHRQEGRWPTNLETLSEQLAEALPGIDLGPIRPVGPRPFGYRVEENGLLMLWSFQVETHDQTPDEPIEATFDQGVSQRNEIRYLRWSLKP